MLLELSTALVDLRCSSSSSPGAGSQGRAGVSTTPFPLPPPLWTRSPSQKLRDSAPIGTSPSPPSSSQPPDCRAYGPASFRPFPPPSLHLLPFPRVYRFYLLMTSETPKLIPKAKTSAVSPSSARARSLSLFHVDTSRLCQCPSKLAHYARWIPGAKGDKCRLSRLAQKKLCPCTTSSTQGSHSLQIARAAPPRSAAPAPSRRESFSRL